MYKLYLSSSINMSLVKLDLSVALARCPAKNGIGVLSLKSCLSELVLSEAPYQAIQIQLSDGTMIQLASHQQNGKTVITSLDSLSSGCKKDGISMEFLPEILTKLAEQKIQFTALQFPHAFQVKGQFSGTAYRAHFHHLVIYKDSKDQLNASIIDSTRNPLGIYNPIPVLGWFVSSSIVSGEELLLPKLIRMLDKTESVNSLASLCDVASLAKVQVANPLLTCKQPSMGDKRCAIYVLNAMVSIINYITSEEPITAQGISETVTAAHQALNEPAMMAISGVANQMNGM
jgi:hypothetical protein